MPYTQLLEQIDIFSDLDTDRLRQISDVCTERRYEKGDIVFHENTDSDQLYVILQGEVEIQVDRLVDDVCCIAGGGYHTDWYLSGSRLPHSRDKWGQRLFVQ